MKYRRLDSSHDYCFGRGQGDYLEDTIENPVAIAQAIKTRLMLYLGEWFLDIKDGLPLWQQILGQRIKNKSIVDEIITNRIKGLLTPDNQYAVTGVSEVSSTYDEITREYEYSCVVDTIFGKLYITNADQRG